jgi:hypothetical protein
MSEDRKIEMPPTDVVITRPVDGWIQRGEVDPDKPPPAVAAMIDEVELIRQRMLARDAAVFGGGDE